MTSNWIKVTVEDIKSSCPNALATGPFGSSISSKFFQDYGVPVIRGGNLSENINLRLIDENLVFLSKEKAQEFKRSIVRKGDLIFTSWGTIGQVGLIDDRCKYSEYVVSNKQMKFTPDSEKADSLFLYYLFSSPEISGRIKNEAIGSSVPGYNLTLLRSIELRLPPLSEQKAIAHILSSFDDKIELNRQMNETLEAMARTIFKSWFVDFDPVSAKRSGRQPAGMDTATADLFPDEFEESSLGLIPKGWLYKPAETICSVGIGKTPPRKESEWFSSSPDDIRWVSIRDMGESGTFIFDTKEYLVSEAITRFNVRVVSDHTVLLSFKLTIGRVAITDGEMTTNEAIAHFKLDNQIDISSEYLYLYLKIFDYNQLGSTSSIAEAINSKIIKAMLILIPNCELMNKFTNQVANIFSKIKNNQRESYTLATLRDTLLPKLMSGEIRVKEAEKDLMQKIQTGGTL